MPELIFIAGSGYRKVGNAAQVRKVEYTLVSLAILSYNPGSVEGEDNWQVLGADIVDYLVERALQEG
jgi:hypothetical protein